MFQKNTSGEARVGARDGYNRMVSPHVRLFPHNISENPSYSLPSTIRCTIARNTYMNTSDQKKFTNFFPNKVDFLDLMLDLRAMTVTDHLAP